MDRTVAAAGVLFACLVATVFVLRALADRQARQRDAEYAAYCSSHGFQYTSDRPGAEAAYANMLALFSAGKYHYWRYEMDGVINGNPFTALEYAYRIEGRYAQMSVHAMMKWERPDLQRPEFFILPASEFEGIARKSHEPRVEFADDRLFTDVYALVAPDPDAVRALFAAEVRGQLGPLLAAIPGQHLYGRAGTLLWYQYGYLPPPEDMDRFIAMGDSIRAALQLR
jgi:hypothetical protein